MKVLYLADAPYIHTRRWVEHFAGRGYDCEVISFRPGEIAGARVTCVEGFERLGKARYLLKARRVAALVRERNPDLLHAHHLTSYGFLGALSGHHPFLLSVWGTDILEAPRWTPFHLWLTRYALRHADEIFISMIKEAGIYDQIWQAFVVYLPVKSVGVQGDGRTHDNVVALRAVTSSDGMTADWYPFDWKFLAQVSGRICNEVRGVNRVVYDVSSKPPATIEWE